MIVIGGQRRRMLFKPAIGIELVEGYAWLQYINQGIPSMPDRLFQDRTSLIGVSDIGPGNEGGIQRNCNGNGVERLEDYAIDLQRCNQAVWTGW